MIRLVMDTNSIIAGSLWPGGPAGYILQVWRERKIELIVSPPILDEVEAVLVRKFETGREAADYLKRVLGFYGSYVDPKREINEIREDPTDNMVLEAAVEGAADFIVTRDKHILKLKEFQRIPIKTPEVMARLIRLNI